MPLGLGAGALYALYAPKAVETSRQGLCAAWWIASATKVHRRWGQDP